MNSRASHLHRAHLHDLLRLDGDDERGDGRLLALRVPRRACSQRAVPGGAAVEH